MKTMVVSGEALTMFVRCCANLEEARRCIPELTKEQFQRIQDCEAHFTGNSEEGFDLA